MSNLNDLPGTMINAVEDSLTAMRARVSNVRYGKPGSILFDFDGETYSVKEPRDVMPVGCGEASNSWALKQYLSGTCTKQ